MSQFAPVTRHTLEARDRRGVFFLVVVVVVRGGKWRNSMHNPNITSNRARCVLCRIILFWSSQNKKSWKRRWRHHTVSVLFHSLSVFSLSLSLSLSLTLQREKRHCPIVKCTLTPMIGAYLVWHTNLLMVDEVAVVLVLFLPVLAKLLGERQMKENSHRTELRSP